MAKQLFVLLALVLAASAANKMSFRQFMNQREPSPNNNYVDNENIVWATVEQHIDNYDPSNHATFEQRYLNNPQFYQPGGPLFIFLSGEWGISEGRLDDSLMVEMSRELYGNMFYLEHRYYGESFPTPDVSDANLRWLTPDQALADIAHFINFIKSPEVTEGAEDSPVILIGAHYSGSLAAWFRQKYPHLALAAWASSAPMLAIINQEDFKVNAAEVYRYLGGNECYDQLEAGFTDMESYVAQGRLQELSEMFSLCDTLDSPQDVSTFFALIAEFYSILTQFGDIFTILQTCSLIQSEEATSNAESIALILGEFFGGEYECFPVDYENLIEYDRQIELDSSAVVSGIRQASFQTCTQFGWHHTSDAEDQPFGSLFGLDFYHQGCEDVFTDVFSNETAHSNADRINTIHGGLEPSVTNVIFTHGSIDPWRTTGILEDLNIDAPAIIINDASQSNDLNSIGEGDSQELIDAKLRIKYLIRLWIARDAGVGVVPT